MVEIRRRDGMSDEARIAKRLRPSNDLQTADTHVQLGSSPTRTHHTVHRSGQNLRHDNPHSKSIMSDLGDNVKVPTAGAPILPARRK
jgi:hypothetical protein